MRTRSLSVPAVLLSIVVLGLAIVTVLILVAAASDMLAGVMRALP